MIFLGADHGGFELKNKIAKFLKAKRKKFNDLGPKWVNMDDDYPDFAFAVAKKVAVKKGNLGILICRSGIGMSIAANKAKGVKSGLCSFVGQAVTARAHNNCNILTLPADFISEERALKIVGTFLEADFCGEERHVRRLKKIEKYERRQR